MFISSSKKGLLSSSLKLPEVIEKWKFALSLSLVTQWTVSVCPLEGGTTGRLRSNFRWISKLLRSQGVTWHKTVTSPCLLSLQREAIAFTHTEPPRLHTPRSSIPSSLPSSPSSVSVPAQSHPHILCFPATFSLSSSLLSLRVNWNERRCCFCLRVYSWGCEATESSLIISERRNDCHKNIPSVLEELSQFSACVGQDFLEEQNW